MTNVMMALFKIILSAKKPAAYWSLNTVLKPTAKRLLIG